MQTTGKRFRLDSKTVLIAGGAGLLGRSFCHALAEAGARLAIADVNADAVLKLCAELETQHKVEAKFYPCDIASEDEVNRLTDAVARDFGSIDVLCANAAKKPDDLSKYFQKPESFDYETWKEVERVNSGGIFLVTRNVGRLMIEKKTAGSIILTSSIYGMVGPDERIYEGSDYLGGTINTPVVYSTTKAALLGMARHLATSWGKHGIRVNALLPGGVRDSQNSTFLEKYSARVPLRRMAEADEVASALVFLASDASSYVTGQSLVVDGGLTAW